METRIFLERYRLSLGRNGLPIEMHRAPAARTYRGHEIDTGREVALTIVSPAPSDPRLLENLETEAIASEEVNHINIPRLYDFARENDELIFVSEYWEGHTASAWVEARGPLSVAAVLRVALQVTDAMNATVFQRLYHPALNPDNILFVAGQTGEGDWPPIKILHWHGPPPSLTQPVDARAESAARFAAPEQLREGKVDVRSEIYSLGATMWFLLTGLSPAADDPGGLRTATSKLRGVPKIVRHLLERMVRPDPRERPQDPVALASYLQTCLARVERRAKMERRIGIPLTMQPRAAAPRTPMPGKRLAAALALLLVAMSAVLFLTLSLTRRSSAQLTAGANQLSASAPGEANSPNKPVVAQKGSTGKTDASQTSLPPAAVAAAPSGSGGELISTSPVPVAVAAASSASQPEAASGDQLATPESDQGTAEPPPAAVAAAPSSSRDELISISPVPATVAAASSPSQREGASADRLPASESGHVTAEPPPPAKGPDARDDSDVADRSEAVPRDEPSPNEIASDVSVAPSPIAESNEEQWAEGAATRSQLAHSSTDADLKKLPKEAQSASQRKTSLSNGDASTKSRTKSLRDSSRIRLAKDRSRSRHTVKRAQPVPQLRVGSAPAEFMGTTPKGNWILYVDDIGETIIVPPPPGYGQ